MRNEQKFVYEKILDYAFYMVLEVINGKAFIWSILSNIISGSGEIVINTALSGITAILLEGGWTLCDIIRSKEEKPFSGKVVVLRGDFWQILPVIPGQSEIVLFALSSSYVWDHCKVLETTKNMRLFSDHIVQESEKFRLFSEWLIAVGDGNINKPNDGILNSIEPIDVDPRNVVNYLVGFLKFIKISDLPEHEFTLKVGYVMGGSFSECVVDNFHLVLAFEIMINKSKSQSLENVRLFFPRHVVSHDQLYISLFREKKSRSRLKIFISTEK
ncbi:hypothetical protein N665_0037s0011 [Sinapis alba]|nr:hypothetical protein N665_0037s0011 [Sinapis alba]